MTKAKMAMKSTKKKRKIRKTSDCSSDSDPVADFNKFSFLVRRSDLSGTSLPCIWSIENHILIAKWVPTDVSGQFQITNRYNLWNAFEKHRYIPVSLDDSEISSSRDSGFVTLHPETIEEIQEYL